MDLRAILCARERLLGVLLMIPGLSLFSVVSSFLIFFGVAALDRTRPEAVLPLLSLLATVVGVFWALSPLLAGVAFTESHDMSRLLHFPIPLPTLVISSLFANLAQPMVLAELPVLVALAAVTAGRPALFPLAWVGVSISFVFILAASQAAGLVLHGLSRNRRFQDLALFLGLALGISVSVAPLMLLIAGPGLVSRLFGWLSGNDLLVLSPFAWGVRASVHAGRGDAGLFVAFAGAGLLAIAAAMGASALLIQLIHRGELNLGSAREAGLGARARMLLPGALGALVEKDLRSAWRDPALKATLFMGVVGPLLFLVFLSQTPSGARSGSAVLLLASFVGLSAFGSNAFGLERRGLALLLGFPVERLWVLLGKNLAAMLYRIPAVAVLLVAGSLLAPLDHLPAAATIALSTLMIAAGVDNYLSILFPAAVPAPGRSPYEGRASGGRGLGAFALTAALIPVVLLLAAPFAFLAWLPLLLELPVLWLGSLPLALAGSAAVYAMLAAGSARLLESREPELLERVLGES
jgi:ABC-2 type transport system permease protein